MAPVTAAPTVTDWTKVAKCLKKWKAYCVVRMSEDGTPTFAVSKRGLILTVPSDGAKRHLPEFARYENWKDVLADLPTADQPALVRVRAVMSQIGGVTFANFKSPL